MIQTGASASLLREGLERERTEFQELIVLLAREQLELQARDTDRLAALVAEKRALLLSLAALHEANERLGRGVPEDEACAGLRAGIGRASEAARKLNAHNARLVALHSQSTHGRLEALRAAAGVATTYTDKGLVVPLR